jgi:hypothetical protein
MQTELIRHHSAVANMARLPSGVISVKVSGPVTVDAMSRFAAELIGQFGRDAVGYLLDYRTGVVLATSAALEEMVAKVPANSVLRKPGAFIGLPGATEPWREQALRMARRGIPRRVFHDETRAHAWVVKAAQRR